MKTFLRVLTVIFGILMIITGFYCLLTPGITYLMVGYAIGVSMIFDGVGRFCSWWQERKAGFADGWLLAGAILSGVFGVILINDAALQVGLDVFIAYYIAVWLLIQGIIVVCRAFKLHKLHKNFGTLWLGSNWYGALILGILLMVFGVLCILNPVIIAAAIGVFIGIGIIVAGASLISLAVSPVQKLS